MEISRFCPVSEMKFSITAIERVEEILSFDRTFTQQQNINGLTLAMAAMASARQLPFVFQNKNVIIETTDSTLHSLTMLRRRAPAPEKRPDLKMFDRRVMSTYCGRLSPWLQRSGKGISLSALFRFP